MCVTETKGCAFDFQRGQAPLYRVKQSFSLISGVVVKCLLWQRLVILSLNVETKTQLLFSLFFGIQSLIESHLQVFLAHVSYKLITRMQAKHIQLEMVLNYIHLRQVSRIKKTVFTVYLTSMPYGLVSQSALLIQHFGE